MATEFDGEIDVPESAIQIIDDDVIKSESTVYPSTWPVVTLDTEISQTQLGCRA